MFGKDGSLICKAFLEWTRLQPCKGCMELAALQHVHVEEWGPAGEAHHFPAIGMGGGCRRDDHVIPLCRRHHEEAQSYVIPKATQARWVTENRSEFLEYCSIEQLQAFFTALEIYKDRPLAVPF